MASRVSATVFSPHVDSALIRRKLAQRSQHYKSAKVLRSEQTSFANSSRSASMMPLTCDLSRRSRGCRRSRRYLHSHFIASGYLPVLYLGTSTSWSELQGGSSSVVVT